LVACFNKVTVSIKLVAKKINSNAYEKDFPFECIVGSYIDSVLAECGANIRDG
jgi:hypothetical protein